MPNKSPSNPPLELCNSTLEQEILTALVHLNVPPEGLVPEDFATPQYRKALRILLSMCYRGEVVTPETFLEQAKNEGMEQTGMEIATGYFPDVPLEMQIRRLKSYTRKRKIRWLTQRYTSGKISEERFFKVMELLREEKQEKTLPTPVSVETLLEVSHPETVWGNVIFNGALHLLSSDPGIGKTTLCYALAVASAEGREFLAEKLSPLRVGYFDLETPAPLRAMKLRVLDYQPGEGMLFFDSSCPVEVLSGLVKKHRLELLIIDTASLFFGVKREEDNAEVNEKVVKPLKELTRNGVAVILVHHNSKGAKERSGVYKSRGASALPAGCDVVLNLENTADEDILKFEVTKNRISGYCPTLYLRKDEGSFAVVERPDSEFTKTQKVEKAILELLKVEGEATTEWLCNAVAFASRKTVQRALTNLVTTGKVIKLERGHYTLPAERDNEKDKCKNDVPNVPSWSKPAWEADFRRDNTKGQQKDMSLSCPLEGHLGHDVSPHIPNNKGMEEASSLKSNSMSLMSSTKGHVPNDVPSVVPNSNPHEKGISGTKGQKGQQFHTCPFTCPNDSSELPEDVTQKKVKWRYHGVI